MSSPPLDEFSRLAAAAGQALRARGYSLAVAESCTGGLLAGAITAVAGASDYFLGGVVSYANEIKEQLLGVSHDTLARQGAVSAATAREMAEGVRRRLGAAVGIGVTGIAGPGGATPTKPVGLVYIAVAAPEREMVREAVWPGDREAVRLASVRAALELLVQALGEERRPEMG